MGREIDVNMLEQYTDDMRLYSVYSALYRVVPDFRDGFKSVQRKIIYAMYNDIKGAKTVKSSSIVGTVMDKYHPHGDTSIYGSMKHMTNWIEGSLSIRDGVTHMFGFQGAPTRQIRIFAELQLVLRSVGEGQSLLGWKRDFFK